MTWQYKKLLDVCEIKNGGTPKTSIRKYWNGKHLWITPAEMGKRFSPFVDDTERKLSDEGLKNCSAQLLPPYSVILSSRAPIGHLVINITEMSTNQGCKGLIPRETLYYKYLYYFLLGNTKELNDLGTGTTFRELSASKLLDFSIPLPPLDEQKRIVTILDEAFAAIDKARENAEKNLANTREVFESYLNGVFSNPGDGWVSSYLNEFIDFIDYRGRTPEKTKSGMRLITAKNVKMGYLQLEPKEYVNPEIYNSWMTRGIPKKGDVIFTTEAPLANVAQLDTNEKVVFSQRIIILHPDQKKIDKAFLKYLLLSKPIQKRIFGKSTGATVKGIKARWLKKIPIEFPGINTQKLIAIMLNNISNGVERLKNIYMKKIKLLEELKKSVMDKAFKGGLHN